MSDPQWNRVAHQEGKGLGAVSRLAHVPLVWCVWPERGTRVADGVFRLPSPPQGIREPATEAEVRSLPCWNGRASWEAHLQWEAVLGRAAGGKGSSSQAWRDGQWCPGTCRTQGGGGLLTQDPSFYSPPQGAFSLRKLWAFTGPGFLMSTKTQK